MQQKHYYGLDVGKFIAAIFVISIHTVPLIDFGGTIFYKLWESISLLAVPFFFICIGVFVGQKTEKGNAEYIKKRAISFARSYLILTTIYLPVNIYAYICEGNNIVYNVLHFFRGFILYGNHYWSWQLWFLLAAFYSLILLYFFIKKQLSYKIIWVIGCVLYVFGVFMTFTPESIVNRISWVDSFSTVFRSFFWNGRIFSSFLCIWIGFRIASFSKYNKTICTLILIPCMLASIYISSFFAGLLRPVICLCLALLLIDMRVNSAIAKIHLDKLSAYIFFIHMYFVFIFTAIIRLNEIQRFFAVTAFSLLGAGMIVCIQKRWQIK